MYLQYCILFEIDNGSFLQEYKKYLMLKGRIHFRAGYGDIATEIIECAGTGVCTSDYDQLTFENVRRPIYPLDLINDPK